MLAGVTLGKGVIPMGVQLIFQVPLPSRINHVGMGRNIRRRAQG